MVRGRISRAIHILTALQSGQPHTIHDLARTFAISRRTLFRDFATLRSTGVPVYYDTKDRCYKIHSHFFLPPPDLTAHETFSLLLLAYKAPSSVPVPFMASALRAALKIQSNLPPRIKRYCINALCHISVRAVATAEADSLHRRFAQFLDAILERRSLRICYFVSPEDNSTVTFLNPHHLICANGTWYVVGESSLHKALFHFKLSHVKELSVLDKHFIRNTEFDPHEYVGRAWVMNQEHTLYNIKLRFAPEAAHTVTKLRWHSTQAVTSDDDGSAIVQFRVDGLNEIMWWILSYGNQVEVLAPQVLKQRIVKIARQMAQANW